jgi:hypothetical protein
VGNVVDVHASNNLHSRSLSIALFLKFSYDVASSKLGLMTVCLLLNKPAMTASIITTISIGIVSFTI